MCESKVYLVDKKREKLADEALLVKDEEVEKVLQAFEEIIKQSR